ncbi:MAG: acyl-CoA dehydrogenase family protein [Actinomycetota bacterium]|nr:MAG: acyl-CoA dehydrogenase family protein [Actinomycetota bacterium]
MDFWLTDDHEALRDGMRAFVQGRFPLDSLHAVEETPAVLDRDRWRELGDMGVFSMRADGMGMRDAVLAFEELGRGLVPGPLVATHLAAGLVDGAAEGTSVVGLFEPQAAGTLVEHATQTDRLLWFDAGTVRLVDPSTLTLDPVERPLDPLSPVWLCTDDAAALDAPVVAEGEAAAALCRDGLVLTAALALGLALAAVDLGTAYAKQREQFGRPIGSFQAVKHMLAEMLVKAEVARSAVYAAACALDDASDADPQRSAAVAKVMAGDAALFNGKTGIQVHGGMGFTWEVDAQRYWKRAVVLDATFGTSDHHATAIAATL